LLTRERIGLVHTHTSLNSEILVRIACFIARTSIICHQHEPTDTFNRNLLILGYQHWLDRITSKAVSKFVAVSKSRFEAMMKYRKYPKEKVELIHNGIRIADFASEDARKTTRKALSLKRDDIAVGLIGRLETAKGQGTFIRAIPDIINRYPNTKFFIIGDDHIKGKPCLTKYKKMIQELELDNICFLLGFRPEINSLMQGMDIIVLPSLWEAHSIVLLEALASKKPVVASRVGGTPEIITHQKEGILISPNNPEALAYGILQLVENPDLVKEITINGFRKVKEEFSEEKMVDKVFEIYKEAVSI